MPSFRHALSATAPLGPRGLLSRALLPCTLLLALSAICALAQPAIAAESQREIRRSFPDRPGTFVELENLAGEMTIEGGASEIEILATVRARDDREADARQLTEKIEIEFEERSDRIVVRALYPLADHDTYHYPQGKSASPLASWLGGSRSQTRYQGQRVTVVGSPGWGSVSLWVDFHLRLPAGVGAKVRNHVGPATASGVEGDLVLDTGSGQVAASHCRGNLRADTGSGEVRVVDHQGDVSADTGSGNVLVERARGSVAADTGSGDVVLTDVEGKTVTADTGSGDVRLDQVSGSISADTGSGDVSGGELVASGRLRADTGSGSVRLAGDFSQVTDLRIDTGSGDVVLTWSAAPAVRLEIETGSGDIEVALPHLRIHRSRRSSFEGEIGDGSGRAVIETGSGDVHVTATR